MCKSKLTAAAFLPHLGLALKDSREGKVFPVELQAVYLIIFFVGKEKCPKVDG